MSRSIENRRELFEANKLHNEVSTSDGRLLILSFEEAFGFFHILDNRLVKVYALKKESHSGEIILSRVLNVKKDIGAVFVKISDEEEGFLKNTNIPERYLPLKQGDLIPVRIISDEQKGKRISVSAKISEKNLPEGWQHKSAFNILCKPENPLLSFIFKRFSKDDFSKMITDSPEVFDIIKDIEKKGNQKLVAELYDDEKISLTNLFSLKTKVSEALSPKVYLKSGGYLVINHTEALTVIDVNSGKNTPSKKEDKEKTVLDLNIEAAKEIALQMKLRNISGMILIDFINMESEEDEELLLNEMSEYVKYDKVTVKVIDITPLGIMEITRQKTDKPLSEIYNLFSALS